MLIAAMVLMLVASVALAVLLCFIKKRSAFFVPLSALDLVALICLGLTCASYRNAFNGYSILIILSILPLFFTLFEWKFNRSENAETNGNSDGENKDNNFPEANHLIENNENIAEKTAKNAGKVQKITQKSGKFANLNIGSLLKGLSYAVSAFCIAFCALYLGKETPYGFFVGIFLALALAFLDCIIKKHSILRDFWGFFEKFLMFLGVGLLLGAILPALLYSFALDNILFALACLSYAAHILLCIYLPNKFNHLAHTLALMLLFATIVF